MPIAVPPGVAGHTPEITLSYNGGSGNGSLGIGWSLDTPAITRQLDKGLPRYTGAAEPATSEDTFLFQGEELVPLSDGTYRCENESAFIRFRKIASDGSVTVDAWQADLPDGGRMLFGTSPTERITRPGANPAPFADTYAWHLSTLADTSGNTIDYQYSPFAPESVGLLYLTRIEYARFSDTVHHRIDFIYSGSTRYPEQRPDRFSDFTAGFERRTSKLLREISVTTDDNLVRRYRLDYDPNPDLEPLGADLVPLEFSLLHRVTQLDRSGLDTNYLPPLRFAYSRFAAPRSAPFLPVSGGQNFLRFGAPHTEVIDINADGLPDFVSSDSAGWFAYLNRGDRRFSDEIPFTATPADGSDQSVGKRLTEPGITLADLDGDGLTDLFQKSATSARILTHRNLNGFREPSTLDPTERIRWGPEIEFSGDLETSEFGALDIAHPSLRMLDLNFDKRTDVMRPFDLGGGTGGIEYILNLPSGWKSELVLALDPRLPQDWSPDEARFDGQNTAVRITGLADLNGDRLEDWFTLARVGDETWIDYWPNANGGHWAQRRSTARIQTPGVRADELRLMDVNADGLTDLVLVRHFELTCWINLGGDRWSDPIQRMDAPPYLEGQTVLRQLDVNGNGTTDLFWDNSILDPGILPPGASAYACFDFVGELKPNLLSIIDNSIGLRTTLEYKSTTHDYLEALESGHPWTTKLPFPLMVVSRVVEDIGLDLNGDGQTDQYLTDFTYRDGYYDSFEQEFRGFAFAEEIERGDDYDPETGLTGPGTGSVHGPSLVTRYRFLTGTPDGIDNDDYPASYQGPIATDEGSGTGGIVTALADDLGGREEESLKGRTALAETVDPAVLTALSSENAGFHAAARATALAALADPSSPEALRCTPDRYVYSRTRDHWSIRRLYRPASVQNPPGRFAAGEPPIHALVGRSVSFPLLASTETEVIEANALLHDTFDHQPVAYPSRPPKVTRSETGHDDYGNVVRQADLGIVDDDDPSAGNDERVVTTTYALDQTALDHWLIRSPALERVEDENGLFIAETRYYYDGAECVGLPLGTMGHRGLLKRTERILTHDPANLPPLPGYDPAQLDRPGDPRLPAGAAINTSRTAHDRYGNPIVQLDPLGRVSDVPLLPDATNPTSAVPAPNHFGHFRIIDYDAARHTYPVRETVGIGSDQDDLQMEASYDAGLGLVTEVFDWNGVSTRFIPDSFGRLVKIIRPGDSDATPSQRFVYQPGDSQRNEIYSYTDDGELIGAGPATAPGPVASAVKRHLREDGPASPEYHTYDAIDYSSGRGQPLLRLSEDEQAGRWIVDGAIRYHLRGQPSAMLVPYYRNDARYHPAGQGGLRHDGTPVAISDAAESFTDALGRGIRTLHPPETAGGMRSFSIAEHLPFEERNLDGENTNPDGPHFGAYTARYQDGLRRLIEVREATRLSDDGRPADTLTEWSTQYTYDLNDRLVRSQDSQGNIQWSRFDGAGRRIFTHDPNRGVRFLTYDPASNPIETLDAKDQRVTFTYDGANRLLTEDYHDEAAPHSFNRLYDPSLPIEAANRPDVFYTYDLADTAVALGDGTRALPQFTRGRRVHVSDLAGEFYNSFDARGRREWTVRQIPGPEQGSPVAYRTSMRYDSLDRLTELTFPDGDRIQYEYNARNLVERITGGAPSNARQSPFIIQGTEHLPSGALAACNYGNGLALRRGYDPRLRLHELSVTTPTSNVLLDYRYAFDAASNLLGIEDRRASNPEAHWTVPNSQSLQYDNRYRLTRAEYPDPGGSPGWIDYRYDRVGNLLEKTSNLQHLEHGKSITGLGQILYGASAGSWNRIGRDALNPGPHALTSTAAGQQARYDANGNLIQLDGTSFTWDFLDRLVVIEDSTTRAEYTYDHRNQRTIRSIHSIDPITGTPSPIEPPILYLNRFFEIRGQDQPVKYVWLGDLRIARVTGTLDESAPRLQRHRLAPGWNLLASAVSASDGGLQLNTLQDPAPAAVIRWNPASQLFDPLPSDAAVSTGDILWVYSTSAGTLHLLGESNEPATLQSPAGASYLALPSLRTLEISPIVASLEADTWSFRAPRQEWSLLSSQAVPTGSTDRWVPPGSALFVSKPDPVTISLGHPAAQIYYYLHDHLDSVNLVTDAEGEIVQEAVYYPFGHPRRSVSTNAAAIGPVSGDYLYSQKEQDTETGFHYFESRYLPAYLGRFASVDPLVETPPVENLLNPQSLQAYGYCHGNPFAIRDPDGRQGRPVSAKTAKNTTARPTARSPRPNRPATARPTSGTASTLTAMAARQAARPLGPGIQAIRTKFATKLASQIKLTGNGRNRALWSGREGRNRIAAQESGKETLESTQLGQVTEIWLTGVDWPLAGPVWRDVSKQFVQTAAGNLDAWVGGAKPTSVANEVELPTAMNTPAIRTITKLDVDLPGWSETITKP